MNEVLFKFFFNLSAHSSEVERIVFYMAEYFGYGVSIAVFLWIVWTFREFFIKKAVIIFAVPTFAWMFAHFLKDILKQPRPFQVLERVSPLVQGSDLFQAFPSGHATFFGALATSVFFYNKKAGIIIALCAFLVGIARIMAGIHWPSDILAGWVLGTLIAMMLNEEWFYKAGEKLKEKN